MDERTKRRSEQGFTLIELMIVVAIIAILAAILIPNFVNARSQAQTAACESNLRAIATALELYYADNQVYPTASSVSVAPALLTANGVTYLNNTPRDPAAQGGSGAYILTTNLASNGSPASYTIVCPGVHVGSTLAKLPLTGGTSGTTCGTSCTATKIQYVAGEGLEAAP
ncbi:MAG: prepilin-type N-terminal cleavage/methylation domain-containing protein [Candidatus Eremiobacteraeota bacterium]|nr:prepilin-type N-terminal cleavage/methylation domain-containing protein [Candidatus Eremiobacteraeota bacterium]MBV8645559.1 prepilin-type N-terminal cleavage/methylation domain-containing protein [Candidatus Eremiobacteraeota bacterium]